MSLTVRALTENDYDLLSEWWTAWKWETPPRAFLPLNGLGGAMVQSDGVDVCAGFLYLTNSSMACVDWIVSNPEYRKKDRKDAIKLLIQTLESMSVVGGATYVYALLKHDGLIETYKELGFTQGDTYNSEMIKWQ
jgi:hypothetical protein